MDRAIRHYFSSNIESRQRLDGGISFQTWLLTLENKMKIIFRYDEEMGVQEPLGNYYSVPTIEVFRREQQFYNGINEVWSDICPQIIVIDGSLEYFTHPFQMYHYIEGESLEQLAPAMSTVRRDALLEQIGELVGRIHEVKLSKGNDRYKESDDWRKFIAASLHDKLSSIMHDVHIDEKELDHCCGAALKYANIKEVNNYLHLDIRPCNIISDGQKLFLIDAENCEWGDPDYELARLEACRMLEPAFLKGYQRVRNERKLDFTSNLFKVYRLDMAAQMVYLYLHIIKVSEDDLQYQLNAFDAAKREVLKLDIS